MYENNNNYTYTTNYTPADPEPPKGEKKAGKIAAFILAVALIGGTSGFGGAYLANSIAAEKVDSTLEEVSNEAKENKGSIPTVTTVPQNSDGKESIPIGSLLNVDSSSSGSLSTQEIIKRATPSVALITSKFSEIGLVGTGTGIVLSSDGYIITNCHVIKTTYKDREYSDYANPFQNPFGFFGGGYDIVEKSAEADDVTITMSDGSEHTAKIIGSDENTDLAILKIDVEGLIPAVIGNSDNLELGETAITLGYPLGLGLSASCGIVSGLEKEITTELSSGGTATMILIQTDASINHGNSGGPLLNSRGEVIGITSSKIINSDAEGMGFAVPITDALPILDELMNKGYVAMPKIGISGTDITATDKRYYNLPVDKGVLVVSVEAGSCADDVGIAEGDIIVAADGKDVDSMNELIALKNKHKPGETMTITIARNDGNLDVDLILDEEPNANK